MIQFVRLCPSPLISIGIQRNGDRPAHMAAIANSLNRAQAKIYRYDPDSELPNQGEIEH